MPKYVQSKRQHRVKTVPYAKGFHPPSCLERKKAIGFDPTKIPKGYEDENSFTTIPHPSSQDDWLAQYAERGQNYRSFLEENPWLSRRKHKFLLQKFIPGGETIQEKYPEGKIYIAQIGNFSKDVINFDYLIDYIKRFLCLPVAVFQGLNIEQYNGEISLLEDPSFQPSLRQRSRVTRTNLKTRYNAKTKHVQVNVDSILSKLRILKPKDALCMIGLTPFDLYADSSDLFVAGMAAGLHQVAVFSLMRYDPTLSFSTELWYDIKQSKELKQEEKTRLVLQRSCKLVVHEICHLLGIDHCIYYSCCMNGSGHLQEDFSQPMMLCPIDLHKLQTLTGFDITIRYRSLLEFFTKHDFGPEKSWVETRLKYLQ